MTKRASFTKADLERALRAAQDSGQTLAAAEISPSGAIRLEFVSAPPKGAKSALDEFLAKQ